MKVAAKPHIYIKGTLQATDFYSLNDSYQNHLSSITELKAAAPTKP